jgi:antitoxin component YwqK of YwqJK toxin-antitoxin module
VRVSLVAILISSFIAGGSAMARSGDVTCPKGTVPNGEITPEVKEAWCEIMWHGKTVQHGPYRSWWPNGKLGTTGQYVYGKAEGKWQGWYSTGQLQGEEWFENGRKVKAIYYDRKGNVAHEPET